MKLHPELPVKKSLLLMLVLFLLTCEKPEFLEKAAVTTGEVTDIGIWQAQASGTIIDTGQGITGHGHCWATTQNPTIENNTTSLGSVVTISDYNSKLTGLEPGQIYYIRAYVITGNEIMYGDEQTFTTNTIVTSEITNISINSATGGGTITDDGGDQITTRGVCWSKTYEPTVSDSLTYSGSGTGNYTSSLTNLSPNTQYYVRAFAMNPVDTTYGNNMFFMTSDGADIVLTTEATDVTAISAVSGGNITEDGATPFVSRGVCWNTTGEPIIDDKKTTDGAGTGAFSSTLTGLSPDTTYFVRAYGTNSLGTVYGTATQFTTRDGIPVLTTTTITDITISSATSGGEITDDGGDAITARGVCWNITASPTTADNKTIDGLGTGVFTSSMTGLSAGVTYYVRSYATNSVQPSYGNELTFTTKDGVATLTTTAITNITATSAVSGGDIADDGGDAITARGVCWNTTGDPTVAESKTTDGAGTGNFISSITGLSPNTTYYVRAYGTNSLGTVYGAAIQFTTRDGNPVLTTALITDITINSATGGGDITDDGSDAITARGVCWNTTGDPTVADSKTTDGSGTGNFTSSITGLSPNTTYYVRAYGTNSLGTVYGTATQFTTRDGNPVLTTALITDITINSATGGGDITDDGGDAITARGVCWNTTGSPTTADNKTIDGLGTGVFTSSMTGLSAGVTYYVRSYATNSVTTTYGNELTFTTQWDNSPITDVEGNSYPTIMIGTQIWLAANLKTTKYNDGIAITLITDGTTWSNLSTEAYCWYNNDEATYKPDYGALYNWYAINTGKLCPTGWHVPTDAEWTVLTDYLGGTGGAGGKLKESGTAHWNSPNTGATNESGFTGLPGGYRFYSGTFYNIGLYGRWWSSTEDDTHYAWTRKLSYDYDYVYRNYGSKKYGFSIRCLRD